MYHLRILSNLEKLKMIAYVQGYFIVISPVQSSGKGTGEKQKEFLFDQWSKDCYAPNTVPNTWRVLPLP